jgi:hypothetical protein
LRGSACGDRGARRGARRRRRRPAPLRRPPPPCTATASSPLGPRRRPPVPSPSSRYAPRRSSGVECGRRAAGGARRALGPRPQWLLEGSRGGVLGEAAAAMSSVLLLRVPLSPRHPCGESPSPLVTGKNIACFFISFPFFSRETNSSYVSPSKYH